MKIVQSECCDCGLPCIGNSCRYYEVERYLCDECGDETTLYDYDEEELCIECIKDRLTVIRGSEY